MFKNLKILVLVGLLGASLSSCGNNSTTTDEGNATGGAPVAANTTGAAKDAGKLADPKSSITYQLELLKAGDVEALKKCFTPRVQDGITKDAVEKAQGQAGKATIDDLYESAEMGEEGGKKTAKVKMKGGRSLTTLVQTDGKWLSDTVWFK